MFLSFDNPACKQKPCQWTDCHGLGKDGTTAARAAADAWLKEVGK